MKHILLLAFTLSLFSCSKSPDKNEVSTDSTSSPLLIDLSPSQFKMAEIQLGKVSTRNMSQVIKVTGMIDVPPQNLISVTAPLGGFVKATTLLQGTHVHQGEVLAIIENPDFIQLQQDYLDNRNKLEFLSLEYKRQQELNAENVSSAKVFQQTTTEYKNIKNTINALEEKLKLAGINPSALIEGKISSSVPIKAGISGYVTTVNVNIGKFVSPNDIMFEIVDTKHLHAELNVFEKDIMAVKIGQKVSIRLSNDPQKEYTGHIHLINHKINTDRTVRVHAHFDKENTFLIPNMFLDAEIATQNENAMVLPNEAIVSAEGKNYIFILTNKNAKAYQFKMVAVSKGIVENNYSVISVDPTFKIDSADIVVKGAFNLYAKAMNTEEE
jgi:RND family efflux transporter MFP subunit